MFKFIKAMLRKHAAKKVAKQIAFKWRAMADIIETPEATRILNRILMVVSDNQEAVEKIMHEAKQAMNEMSSDKDVIMAKVMAMSEAEADAYLKLGEELTDEMKEEDS